MSDAPVEKSKLMDVAEFSRLGFLQEINRQVLHPAGLALYVDVDLDTGEERLGGIFDAREDPEGMVFNPGVIDPVKVETVLAEQMKHLDGRMDLMGSMVQHPDYEVQTEADRLAEFERRNTENGAFTGPCPACGAAGVCTSDCTHRSTFVRWIPSRNGNDPESAEG